MAKTSIFRTPRASIHRFRIWWIDWSVVDVLLTLVLAYVVAEITSLGYVATLILVFLVGQCIHARLRIQTAFQRQVHSFFKQTKETPACTVESA